jgi:hypothetical protein
VRTLLVGDEPRDIVFADPPGATGLRAFITTAHRGQRNTPLPPTIESILSTPGHRPRRRVGVRPGRGTARRSRNAGLHRDALRRHARAARRARTAARSTPPSSTPVTRRRRSPRA